MWELVSALLRKANQQIFSVWSTVMFDLRRVSYYQALRWWFQHRLLVHHQVPPWGRTYPSHIFHFSEWGPSQLRPSRCYWSFLSATTRCGHHKPSPLTCWPVWGSYLSDSRLSRWTPPGLNCCWAALMNQNPYQPLSVVGQAVPTRGLLCSQNHHRGFWERTLNNNLLTAGLGTSDAVLIHGGILQIREDGPINKVIHCRLVAVAHNLEYWVAEVEYLYALLFL